MLKRCLEKDPENRWQTAGDLKAALELAGMPQPVAAPDAEPVKRGWLWASVAAVLLVALVLVSLVHFRETSATVEPVRFTVPPPGRRCSFRVRHGDLRWLFRLTGAASCLSPREKTANGACGSVRWMC